VLRDGEVHAVISHETSEDYSSWLLPAVGRALGEAGVSLAEVDAYAVAAGPGSFTGVRIGLTTVKAWSEVFGRPIAAVSRLDSLVVEVAADSGYAAAVVDAHREQVFAALYRAESGRLKLVEEEMVISPDGFLAFVDGHVGRESVSWVSLDVAKVLESRKWRNRESAGDTIRRVSPPLAPSVGRIGLRKASEGTLVDALALDADYVRRSDAEIFWKRGTSAAVK